MSWAERLEELRLIGEMTGVLGGLLTEVKDTLDPKVYERAQNLLTRVKAKDFRHKMLHAGGMKALVTHEAS